MMPAAFYALTQPAARLAAMLRVISTLPALILILISASAQAEERRYQVELLVFSYEQQDPQLTEIWPDDLQPALPSAYQILRKRNQVTDADLSATQPSRKKVLQQLEAETAHNNNLPPDALEYSGALPMTTQQQQEYRNGRRPDFFLLPGQYLKLHSQSKRLQRRNAFRILFHQSWRMNVHSKEEALPIRITGGERLNGLYELDGTIKISVARYLHLDTQLYLREFEALAANTGSDSTDRQTRYQVKRAIPMIQSRRMRSGELHYIDHPKYGVLVQFTPL